MNRREFVKYLALLAAGAAAMPAQIAAYERLYNANMPDAGSGLISVREFFCGFQGTPRDCVALVTVGHGSTKAMPFAMNTRSFLRWVAAPDTPLLVKAEEFYWTVIDPRSGQDADPFDDFTGRLIVTDQDARIHYVAMTNKQTRLSELLK